MLMGKPWSPPMPSEFHQHDAKWIAENIGKLPPAYQQQAAKGYTTTYTEAYDAEPVEHKKQNAARFAANTRLREYVDRVLNQL